MDTPATQIALKEWAVAVRAMEAGRQDVIFRKGGIQEPEGDFRLAHNEFYLYPAREHQKPDCVKPQFMDLLQATQSEQKGQLVSIRSHAMVVRHTLISSLDEARKFEGRHIWNDAFIQMRLDYKPDRPLFVVELLIEELDTPFEFVETTQQGGCRSWVEVGKKNNPVTISITGLLN